MSKKIEKIEIAEDTENEIINSLDYYLNILLKSGNFSIVEGDGYIFESNFPVRTYDGNIVIGRISIKDLMSEFVYEENKQKRFDDFILSSISHLYLKKNKSIIPLKIEELSKFTTDDNVYFFPKIKIIETLDIIQPKENKKKIS